MTPALVAAPAAGLAAALLLGAAVAPGVLLVAVAAAQAAVILGWHRALDVPGAGVGAVVAGVAALAADGLVLAAEGDRPLAPLPAVLALSVLAGLGQQLLRRDGRDRLTVSLSATVALCAVTAPASTYLAVEASDAGTPLVVVAAGAAGVVAGAGAVRQSLGAPGWLDPFAVAGSAVAALALPAVTDLSLTAAAVVAAAAGGTAWAAGVLVARAPHPHPAVAAGLGLSLAAPVAYVLGRLLVG
jgi:hypothetical protein